MLKKGYVASYTIVTNKKIVRVALTPQASNDPYIKGLNAKSGIRPAKGVEKQPQFYFTVPDVANFDEQINNFLNANPTIIRPKSDSVEEEKLD